LQILSIIFEIFSKLFIFSIVLTKFQAYGVRYKAVSFVISRDRPISFNNLSEYDFILDALISKQLSFFMI